jgi:hypothetical protein
VTLHTEAIALLEAMAMRHIELRAEGKHILFRPAGLVSEEDRRQIRALKSQLMNLLAPGALDLVLLAMCVTLPPEDAQDLRQERAAILEFEGGHTRVVAEHLAGLSGVKRQMSADAP